jgi:hypothetical protein
MKLKRILTAVLATGCIPFLCSAQGTASGDVTVRSTPEGARVTISGDVVVSGVTPARFHHLLIGDYKLVLKKYGYESHSSRVVLDPTRQIEINIRLSPKTRLKAAARSFFIPGWGQKYTDQKTKGYLFGALAVGSVLAYLIADDEFDYRYDLYINKLNKYDSLMTSGNIDELSRLKTELDKAQDDAYDAENVRRATIGTVVAVWGINLLDILFFYPEQRATFSIKGLAISPSADSDLVGLTLSKRF